MRQWTSSAVKKKPHRPRAKRKDSGRLSLEQFDAMMPQNGHRAMLAVKILRMRNSVKQAEVTK